MVSASKARTMYFSLKSGAVLNIKHIQKYVDPKQIKKDAKRYGIKPMKKKDSETLLEKAKRFFAAAQKDNASRWLSPNDCNVRWAKSRSNQFAA